MCGVLSPQLVFITDTDETVVTSTGQIVLRAFRCSQKALGYIIPHRNIVQLIGLRKYSGNFSLFQSAKCGPVYLQFPVFGNRAHAHFIIL